MSSASTSRIVGLSIFIGMALLVYVEYLAENGLIVAARAGSSQNAVIDMVVFVVLLLIFAVIDAVVLFFGTIIGGSLLVD